MDNNIVNLVPKVEKVVNTYIEIIYTDNTSEKVDADYFGSSESIPDFIMVWKEDESGNISDNTDVLYINKNSLKMMRVVSEVVSE